MKVSIVINTFNRMHTLPKTLQSLQYLRYSDFEVIVVDGPSTDGTRSYLNDKWFGKVKILSCEEANLSMSRNIGICAASGDIIAFTDDDGIPEADWLDHLVAGYEDNSIAAVGGFVRNHTGVEWQTKYINSNRVGDSSELMEEETVFDGFTFPRLIGVNSSFRRFDLLKIGGFDEEFAYFYDEVDVCLRLLEKGRSIKIQSNAEVHHKYAPSHIRNEKGVAKSWFVIARSTSYYCIKSLQAKKRLFDVFDVIENHKKRFYDHTLWALNNKLIDRKEYLYLIKTLTDGFNAGVRDAFEYPDRKLINCLDSRQNQFLPFPALKQPISRLKIAFITDLYPPRPCGGVAVFIHQLATQLASLGHEVTVITFAEVNMPHTVDFEDGVWVHRIHSEHSESCVTELKCPEMPSGIKGAADAVLSELVRVNSRRQFDWVVGTIWDMHLASVIAAKRWKVAMYLVTSYKLMLDSKPEWTNNQNIYKNHVLKMIETERWGLENVDVVIGSTNAILNDVQKQYDYTVQHDRVAILPFGITSNIPFEPLVKSDKNIHLLFVGRFETRKGIDLLLRALPSLLSNFSELTVTLVGDNSIKYDGIHSYWEEFKKQYSKAQWFSRIEVTGLVSDEQLNHYYRSCDIFIAPSRYESFGLIYLEAMRYAKPCIGTRVGGIVEVIDENCGIFIEPSSAEDIISSVTTLIQDEKLRYSLGNAGRQKFLDRFTVEKFADGFESLLVGKS